MYDGGWKPVVALIIAFILIDFFAFSPVGRGVWNSWFFTVQKVDDATSYTTRKQVEDACRAMMASYKSDYMVYEQYKDSENNEMRSWAAQAKMRANKTAASYNEYILKNTFVWNGNVPKDIKESIPYLN